MSTTQSDKNFFDLFMLVIGILIGVTFGLFLLSNYIAGKTQEVYILQDEPYQEQVLDNVRPIGRVALIGEDVAETTQEIAAVEPVAEVLSGPQVYNQACLACHGSGVGGAPTTGDTGSWQARLAKGIGVLKDHAINGFTGDAGFMPAKGGRVDLSDGEILAAVDYMIEQSR
jgi:cytochrome c5